jgi:hypothetical protein
MIWVLVVYLSIGHGHEPVLAASQAYRERGECEIAAADFRTNAGITRQDIILCSPVMLPKN